MQPALAMVPDLHTVPAPSHKGPSRGLHASQMADHREISVLFDEVIAAFRRGDRDEAAETFTRFEKRLERHLDFEDGALLPALQRVLPDEATTLAADHRLIRTKLTELGVGVDLHLTRATWVADLIVLLRAHAARDDDILYQWADDPEVELDEVAVLRKLPAI